MKLINKTVYVPLKNGSSGNHIKNADALLVKEQYALDKYWTDLVKPQEGIVMSVEELTELLKKAFDAGCAYTVAGHKDFKQIHPNKEEFVNSIIENK